MTKEFEERVIHELTIQTQLYIYYCSNYGNKAIIFRRRKKDYDIFPVETLKVYRGREYKRFLAIWHNR